MAKKSKDVNPVLKEMGFGAKDRVVVFHADDIGMCQSTIPAWERAVEYGVLSSAATMVPCPWFPALARSYREDMASLPLDLGVHLTLTSEWREYRWGPIATRDKASGLLDADGYFPHTAAAVVEHAVLDALEAELRAQIERAVAAGIDITHIDSHMLTLMHPRFLPIYFKLAYEFRVPAFMVRNAATFMDAKEFDEEQVDSAQSLADEAQERGMALFDHALFLPLSDPNDRVGQAKKALKNLPAGLTNFIVHPAAKSPELRALAPDWKARVADAELFVTKEWRKLVADSGVQVIGFRALRDHMRSANK